MKYHIGLVLALIAADVMINYWIMVYTSHATKGWQTYNPITMITPIFFIALGVILW